MSIATTRIVPDYIGNLFLAKQQAKQIKDYWHIRGYKDVRVWVEPSITSTGTRLYFIRSNMIFRV